MVPFGVILEELRRLRYDGWIVVEQDVVPGAVDCVANARRNLAYLTWLGMEVVRP
jgi:sugar phosphate isomerase/epimerase